jgi:hypothetical protein
MTNRKSIKQIITEAVLAELPENKSIDSTADNLMMRIWISGRQDGLRLTEYGDFIFRMAEIEYYQSDFKLRQGTSEHAYVMEINKKIKCPFYLGVNKIEGKKKQPYIRLYDSKIAMMIELYGDIVSYLDSVKVRK